MNKEKSQIAGAVVGGICGLIHWVSLANDSTGSAIFLIVLWAWGGSYVFNKLFEDQYFL